MTFRDLVFPDAIGFGAQRSLTLGATSIETEAGVGTVVNRWDSGKRTYDVAFGIHTAADLKDVLNFFMAVRGPVDSFRFKDWFDFTSAADHISTPTATDQFLGTIAGAWGVSPTQSFNLVKHYVSGNFTSTRRIMKPITGTVLVAVDGVTQIEGVHYTVDYTLGTVSISGGNPIGRAVTAGFHFHNEVRLLNPELMTTLVAYQAEAIEKVLLEEIIGQDYGSCHINVGGSLNAATIIKYYEVTLAGPRTIRFTSSPANGIVYLPDPRLCTKGGPHFRFFNDSAQTIIVKDLTATPDTIASLAATQSGEFFVTPKTAGDQNRWIGVSF